MVFRRALRAGEVRALTDELQQRSTRRAAPLLRVGTCAAPPTIDGKLDDPAWTRAAGLTGLSNIFHQRLSGLPTTVRVCRDSERLYIAYQCAIPKARRPGQHGRADTARPGMRTRVEVPRARPRAALTTIPLVATLRGADPGLHSGQKAGMATAGGDLRDRDHWCAEVSIPFASLGRGTTRSGQLWRATSAAMWPPGQGL